MKTQHLNYNSANWEICIFSHQVDEFVHQTFIKCIVGARPSIKSWKWDDEQNSSWLPKFQSVEKNQGLQSPFHKTHTEGDEKWWNVGGKAHSIQPDRMEKKYFVIWGNSTCTCRMFFLLYFYWYSIFLAGISGRSHQTLLFSVNELLSPLLLSGGRTFSLYISGSSFLFGLDLPLNKS